MYRVEWLHSALNELAAIWMQGDSTLRRAVTAAATLVEQRLQLSAPNEGESRSRGRRITLIPPLAITFRLELDGRTVTILKVVHYGRVP